jgi:hypothetical protein
MPFAQGGEHHERNRMRFRQANASNAYQLNRGTNGKKDGKRVTFDGRLPSKMAQPDPDPVPLLRRLTAAELVWLTTADLMRLAAPTPSAEAKDRWAALPPGQRRAVEAYVGSGERTIAAAANAAGISPNTLKVHLRRIRVRHPELWPVVRSLRSDQLAARPHAGAGAGRRA